VGSGDGGARLFARSKLPKKNSLCAARAGCCCAWWVLEERASGG
jgi:hypothetical protein